MEIKLSLVNEILADLEDIRNSYGNKKMKKITEEIIYEINNSYGDGEQGAEGQKYEIYQYKGLFIKLDIRTDSYGENESVRGIQFVTPTEKTVLVYEPIKN